MAYSIVIYCGPLKKNTPMTISEEWRHGQQKRNNEEQRDISRYKLLLENRAEKKPTQFRKESLSQKKTPKNTQRKQNTTTHTKHKNQTWKRNKGSKAQDFSVVVECMKKTSLRQGRRNIYNYIKPVTTTIWKAKHCQAGNNRDNETICFAFWTKQFYRPT